MSGKFLIETRRFDATGLSGTAQNIGAVTTGPVVKVMAINTSDVSAYITWADNQMEVPAEGTATFDESTSRYEEFNPMIYGSKGVQFQATQVTGAGTSGHIILNLVELRT